MVGSEQANFATEVRGGEAIARLNDELRKNGTGGDILITQGVLTLSGFERSSLLRELASYDGFDLYNDPQGQRDFGDLQLFGADLLWKIDYFDLQLEHASADPADRSITKRVLTIMLETEY